MFWNLCIGSEIARIAIAFALGAALVSCAPNRRLPPQPRLDPDLVQRGAFLFRDNGVSGDGRRSCATCHPGGGSDGKAYRQGEPVEHGSEDARLTLPTRGIWLSAPYLSDGSIETAEQVIDRMLRIEMRNSTLAGRDLAALVAYALSIPPFDRGRVQEDGIPVDPSTLASQRGYEVFLTLECDECHPPPLFTRAVNSDVGSGGLWNVPSLLGVSKRSPYGHDGRWQGLEEAVKAMLQAGDHKIRELEFRQLIEYLELL
ncbi:MAG: hypothetical protein GY725_22110 [bacterium]|nr:hypothetical protein [bacterium]